MASELYTYYDDSDDESNSSDEQVQRHEAVDDEDEIGPSLDDKEEANVYLELFFLCKSKAENYLNPFSNTNCLGNNVGIPRKQRSNASSWLEIRLCNDM